MGLLLFAWVDEVGHHTIRGGMTGAVTGRVAAAMDRRDMGQDITGGTIVGSVAGGLAGSKFPQFSGVKGGDLANISAEIGHEAFNGL